MNHITALIVKTGNIFGGLTLKAKIVTGIITVASVSVPTLTLLNILPHPNLPFVIPSKEGIYTNNIASRSELDPRLPANASVALQAGLRGDDNRVLGTTSTPIKGSLNIKIPSNFYDNATVKKDLVVEGKATFSDSIIVKDKNLDLGSGELTASNVLYSLTSGDGLSITSGQSPTIKNTGVLSLGTKTGALVLEAGTDITIDGLKITNKSTLDTVRGRGGCSSCITDADVVAGLTISGGTVNNSTIGATTASTGAFTTLSASSTLGVTGATTLSSTLAVTGASTLTGAVTASSTLAVSGATTLNGNVTLGDASSDTITFTGRVASNIVPSTSDTYTLGTSSLPWSQLYLSGVSTLGGQSTFTASPTGTGVNNGSIYINPSSVSDTSYTLFGIAVGGEERLRMDATGNITVQGNLVGPTGGSIGYWSRAGTRVYPYTINDTIGTFGNVGVGTTGTSASLYVNGNAMIGYSSGGPGSLSNGLAVSGNVGIGTTNPGTSLDVRGNITLLAGSDIRPTADSITALNIANAAGTDFVTFDTTNSRVGIGTASPGSALTIIGNVGVGTSAAGAGLQVSGGGLFGWGTASSAAPSNGLGVSGNVGIGTTSPSNPLEISSTSTPQMRIAYDGTYFATESVSSAGALTIDTNSTGAINIGTGSNAKTVTIGNGTTSSGLAFTSGTGSQTFTSSVATTTTTSGAWVLTGNSLTSGTGLYTSSTTINTGKLAQVSTGTANTLTTGTLFDARTTATSLTGTAGVGALINLDWSPGSATTATGDLFALNIGTNGTTTGNLFNILDASSSIFSVSEVAVTTSLPFNETAPGDVSIAYDLVFSNPTASFIKSDASLSLVTGEAFSSSNLSLATYNSGQIILDSAGGVVLSQYQPWQLSTTSTMAWNIQDSSGNNLLTFDTTNQRVGVGTTGPVAVFNIASTATSDLFRVDDNGRGDTSPFVVDQVGNVGIANSAPSYNLDVVGSLRNSTGAVLAASSGNVGIGTATAGSKFSVIGNVGIGTSAAGAALQINGGGLFGWGTASSAAPSNGLAVSGNVGIGTTTTNAPLEVLSTTTPQFRLSYDGTYFATEAVSSAGALTIDTNSTGAINIGTGSNAKTVTIGNGTTSSGLAFTSGTGTQTFTSSVVSTNTTSSGFVFTDNTTLTGTEVYIGSTGVSSGILLNIDASATTTLTTGKLLSLTSVSNALTSGSFISSSYTPGTTTTGFTGNLNFFDYSPTATPTTGATGDILRLNLGSNATNFTGNLLNIVDSSSSVFSISKVAVTTSLPFNETAPGDVSMAYDLVLNNPTSSFIKSDSNLTLVAGEVFNSSNLSLVAYNNGTIVLDSAGGVVLSQYQPWQLNTTSTMAWNIQDSSGNNLLTFDTTNQRVGIGITGPASKLDVNGNQTIGSGYVRTYAGPTNGLLVQGNVGIGTSNGTGAFNLDVVGTGRFSSALSLGSGTASTPGLNFSGDTDTGLWSVGTNILGLTTNGSGSLQSGTTINGLSVNANGNVGIGTTNPGTSLDVRGNITLLAGSDIRPTADSTTALNIANAAGTDFVTFDTTNSRVGIGTASPGSALTIIGNVGVGTSASGAALQVNGGGLLGWGTASSAAPSNGLAVSGNVGIGTTTADYNLSVVGTLGVTGGNNATGTGLYVNSAGNIGIGTSTPSLARFQLQGSGTSTGINFLTTGSNLTQGLTVLDNGNVGIGTTNPNNKLQVVGYVNFNDGVSSMYLGYQAGNAITSGSANTFVGYQAGLLTTTGSSNSAFGRASLVQNTTGYNNSAFGQLAMWANTTGIYNSAFGDASLDSNTSGSYNSAFGESALTANTTGSANSAFGYNALVNLGVGTSNAVFGYAAGDSITGSSNTIIGTKAGDSLTSGSGNIVIGYLADALPATSSNLLNIGNLIFGEVGSGTTISTGNVGIGTSSPAALFHVQGTSSSVPSLLVTSGGNVGIGTSVSSNPLTVGTDGTNGNGAYLSAGGSWQNGSSFEFKENFTELNSLDILSKINSLNLTQWNYKLEPDVKHIGPVAEEFYSVFGLGNDNKHISTIDPSGVALAGIQGLSGQINDLDLRFKNLDLRFKNQEASLSAKIASDSASLSPSSSPSPIQGEGTEIFPSTLVGEGWGEGNLKDKIASLSARLDATIESQRARIAELENSIKYHVSSIMQEESSSSAEATPSASSQYTIYDIPHTNLTDPSILLATSSAQLTSNLAMKQFNNLSLSEATISGMLKTYDLNISNSLKSLGTTTLGQTNINGDLIIDGTTNISGDSLNSIPTLYIQNSALSTHIDIFNGKIKIDKSGNITTEGEITVKKLTVSSDSAGTATILAGQTKVTITSSVLTANSKIFVTPKKPVLIAVTDQNPTNHTFTVELDAAKSTDIKFDWWIVDSVIGSQSSVVRSELTSSQSASLITDKQITDNQTPTPSPSVTSVTSPPPSWQDDKGLGTIEAINNSVDVNTNPNSAEKLTQIIPGTRFYIQEVKDEWIKVEYQPEVYGWVIAKNSPNVFYF